MPLIIMTGIPSSGKTTRAQELKTYFEEIKNKLVHVVCEKEAILKSGFSKNELFLDSQKEKLIRGILKSDVLRLMNKDNVVIVDAGNYIKGFRYELYCGSKAARVPQCTVWTAIPAEAAWELNIERSDNNEEASNSDTNFDKPYTREVFDELCFRYEEPNSSNRWDSPLFSIFPSDVCRFEDIYKSLFEKDPPPPNMSTQNPPLSAPNYLYEMDKITQDIVSSIVTSQKMGNSGLVKIPGTKNITVDCPSGITVGQLTRLRRQFLNYSKMHTASSSIEMIPQLFAQFLNTNLN